MDNNGGNNTMNESGGPVVGSNSKANEDPTFKDVLSKIRDADSVLVALSNDPTVDEIAAAMGLSMALDEIGKHVTAIYSGKTPNVLEFLKPRERFETGTESLQDFVIALNKDKADHLRYKIDGDFVKVYVTPYKTTISDNDLEFSRGDYNVDLVIALNVPAATELDAALNEYGRIMHDATSINITNGTAGNFGDLEWVDTGSSSISEMVSKLAFALDEKMDSSTATALLTGLVAATDRFKNPETTPEAMALAAKLMGAGADQQLVVQNVQGEVIFNGESGASGSSDESASKDTTQLEISHDEKGDEEEEKEVNIDSSEMAVDAEKKEEEQESADPGSVVSDAEPEGWNPASSAGNATLSKSTDARNGNFACAIAAPGSQNKRLATQEMTLEAGSYTFSFYAKATTGSPSQTRAGYVPIKADGSVDTYKYGDFVDLNNSSWTLVTYSFELTATTKLCLLVMNPKNSSYSTSQDVLVDDATLVKNQ